MPDHNDFTNLIWQIVDLLRGPYRPPQYEREIQKRTDGEAELPPYCQVAVWWLRIKLAGMG
jgi:hypothetical protein